MSGSVWIIDTNVVVAGLLTANNTSPVVRIVDGMLAAAFPFVISHALLAEYRAVLLRPAIRRTHRLTVVELDTILTALARNAIVLASAAAPRAPDPGDQLLWDLLSARADLRLVTGDKLLLNNKPMRGRVVSPRKFVEAF